MKGFIKLSRELTDWEWYQDSTACRLYIHLKLRANYTDKKWQGTLVKRGQLISSNENLARDLNLSFQQIRTGIKKLKSSGYITTQTTNKFTLITIVDYEETQARYAPTNMLTNTLATNKQQSTNKKITTTKESKNLKEKNIETIKVRKQNFKNDVFKHSNFSNEILKGFFTYWSEFDSKSNKLRFEKQIAFEIKIRLNSWKKNELKWNDNSSRKKSISSNR
ncbi:hypothetical protein JQC67_03320 [Aurantibacter crassamenti]|uniref:hypothetical protein n=1 Tax=Aurantibacter crassamenti TaxID=1837375 RepID=UPI00193A78B5|nr:hypothetical protein [Aurantibacter crassamenti]MBM1105163.1 hypothetical protein [Aurantibacter crassamenti]